MSDPVNSSDEADALVETLVAELGQRGPTYRRALHRLAAAVRAEAVADPDAQPCTSCEEPTGNPDTFCDACKLDELEQECDRLRAKLAEAVADERRRIDGLLRQVDLDAAIQGNWSVGKYAKAVRDVRDSLAAGSVPVATPPAEPAAPRLWPCEHGERGWHRTDDNRHCLGGAAPSRPVTCEHGKTGWHLYVDRRSPISGTRQCPGPVSVPKESSE